MILCWVTLVSGYCLLFKPDQMMTLLNTATNKTEAMNSWERGKI